MCSLTSIDSLSDCETKDSQVSMGDVSLAPVAAEKGPLPSTPEHQASALGGRSGANSFRSVPSAESWQNIGNGTGNNEECKTGGGELYSDHGHSAQVAAAISVSSVPSSGYNVAHATNRRYSVNDESVNSNYSVGSSSWRRQSAPVAVEETKSNHASTSMPHRLGPQSHEGIRKLSKYLVRQQSNAVPPLQVFEAIVFIPKKGRLGLRSSWISEKMVIGTFNTFSEAEQMCIAFSPPLKQEPRHDITCEMCKEACGMIMKRKKTCKNCGRWVCPQCSQKKWQRAMFPYTYVLDKPDPKFRVCDVCFDVCEDFRQALLRGDELAAMKVYSSGCINLRTPYPLYTNERPVHCAAHGGNLRLLMWLVEDRHCPIFHDDKSKIALGDGLRRSVLGIAARGGHLDMVRYLLAIHKCNISEVTELSALWHIITALLEEEGNVHTPPPAITESLPYALPCQDIPFTAASYSSNITEVIPSAPLVMEEAAVPYTAQNECIVCFEKVRNCTLVPCGHLACCYECGLQLKQCCVCRQDVQSVI